MKRRDEIQSSVNNINIILCHIETIMGYSRGDMDAIYQLVSIIKQEVLGVQSFCVNELNIIDGKARADSVYFDKNPSINLLHQLAKAISENPSGFASLIGELYKREHSKDEVTQSLIETVIEVIKEDIINGKTKSLEEIIEFVPRDKIVSLFIPDDGTQNSEEGCENSIRTVGPGRVETHKE